MIFPPPVILTTIGLVSLSSRTLFGGEGSQDQCAWSPWMITANPGGAATGADRKPLEKSARELYDGGYRPTVHRPRLPGLKILP